MKISKLFLLSAYLIFVFLLTSIKNNSTIISIYADNSAVLCN